MEFHRLTRNLYAVPTQEFDSSERDYQEDFDRFHLPLAQMHHASLHGPGVVQGLAVEGALGGDTLTVHAGLAVDSGGRLISLSPDGTGDIGANPPRGVSNEQPVPVALATAGHEDSTVYVTVQFSELVRPQSGNQPLHLEQVPWLRLQPAVDPVADIEAGRALVLAIAAIDAEGKLAALREVDPALAAGRRSVAASAAAVHIRRSGVAGGQAQETPAGTIGPADGGGLRIAVPENDDQILFTAEDGGSFAELEVQAGDLRTLGNLQVEGTATLGGNLDVGSSAAPAGLHVTANLQVDGDVSVGGTATLGGPLSVAGPTALAGATLSGPLQVDGPAQVAALDVTGDLTISGNVGVGVAAPSTGLDVAGDIQSTGIVRAANGFRPDTDDWEIARNGEHLEIREPEQQDKVWARFEDDRGLHLIGTPDLWVDGRIGIGTTSPRANLEIAGDREPYLLLRGGTHRGDIPELRLEQITAGIADAPKVTFLNPDVHASNLAALAMRDRSAFTFEYPLGSEHMRIDPAGHVGIGTSNPQVRLHIDRGTDAEVGGTGGYLVIGNVDGANVALDNNEILARNGTQESTLFLQANGGDLWVHSKQSQTTQFIVKDNGFVGIGTQSPSTFLQVRAARCNGTAWLNASSIAYKEKIHPLPLPAALQTLRGLAPVIFHYKESAEEKPHAGFIAEDVPELVATEDRKSLDPLEIVAVLARVVQHQQAEIEALRDDLGRTGG